MIIIIFILTTEVNNQSDSQPEPYPETTIESGFKTIMITIFILKLI
jgi:hypothetical protein